MDWVDTHAYHQHPQFPGKDWDANNFRIGNTPLVQDGGESALAWIEAYRVAGKPLTVGECDHPYPNEYAAEMAPVVFSFAAWQDWDGVFFWLYHARTADWEQANIGDYFDQNGYVAELGFLPAAAEPLLRGIAPAPPARRCWSREGG